MTAFYVSRGVVRATVGDGFYGPSCPLCAGPKDKQALECRDCYLARVHDDGYWNRRTCACGGAKARKAARCSPCQCARQRTVGVLT